MYDIHEIELRNGKQVRKRLVITFSDPAYEIVGVFLMSDAPMFRFELIEDIDRVLQGHMEPFTQVGNRCEVVVGKKETVISDVLADTAADATMPSITIPTASLLEWMRIWREKLEEFTQK